MYYIMAQPEVVKLTRTGNSHTQSLHLLKVTFFATINLRPSDSSIFVGDISARGTMSIIRYLDRVIAAANRLKIYL